MPLRFILTVILLLTAPAVASADDWPTLRHDMNRSGLTADCVGPPYEQAWVAVFDEETIPTRTEPIVAGGRLFVGTYSGRLHCLNAADGSRLLADQAPAATRRYMTFTDHFLPTRYLTGEERQFHFGENFVDYPDFALAIFQARAYVERAPAEKLAGWIDIPWCPGDLYYIQRLSMTLDAAGRTESHQ